MKKTQGAAEDSFTKRTERFWEWFSKNEKRLSEMVSERKDEDSEKMVEFISKGVDMISKDLKFNVGGDHEFTFSVEGKYELFFLLPYVTENLPERYSDKWSFFSCMRGTGGESFGFRGYGADVAADRVMVSASAEEGGNTADITFYAKELEPLEEQARYNVFFVLMDLIIGEALSNVCVGDVEWADAPSDGMMPLTELEQWMTDNLCEDGELPVPADTWFNYEREPADHVSDPRGDVIAGFTVFTPMVSDYYNGNDEVYQKFMEFGAKPVFLYYYYDGEADSDDILDERQEIMDMLEEKVLGERGSGHEIGLMIGSASGIDRLYIDMLLYDEQAFMEKARKTLADLPYMFFCKEFCRNGKESLLTDRTVPGFRDRLVQLHDVYAHKEIIRIIEGIPADEIDFGLNGTYARALMNDRQYEKAIVVLESVRDQGEKDALWNWRMGGSLFFRWLVPQSIPYLQKAIELGDDDPETADTLRKAFAILKKEETEAERRASKAPFDQKRIPFMGFDTGGFWEEGEEAQKYTGTPAADGQFAETEKKLGYKLPASYKWLIEQRNGGVPVNKRHTIDMPIPWDRNHTDIECIMGIDPSVEFSLLGELGTKYMVGECGYPDIGVVICPVSGNRDLIFLDYRHCGPEGEPEVALVDRDWNNEIIFLADNFESFIRGLTKGDNPP